TLTSPSSYITFTLFCPRHPTALHSFPTRRSSDLRARTVPLCRRWNAWSSRWFALVDGVLRLRVGRATHVAQCLQRARRVPALDLNLYRTRREVEAAEQATETDQVLDPLPFCHKGNVGGLEHQLGRRDEHLIPGREHRHEVERIGAGH